MTIGDISKLKDPFFLSTTITVTIAIAITIDYWLLISYFKRRVKKKNNRREISKRDDVSLHPFLFLPMTKKSFRTNGLSGKEDKAMLLLYIYI